MQETSPPRRRTFATFASALIGVVWAAFCAFLLLGALLQGPPLARAGAASLFLVGALSALPWTVAWLRSKLALFRPSFAPPVVSVIAAIVGLGVIVPHNAQRTDTTEAAVADGDTEQGTDAGAPLRQREQAAQADEAVRRERIEGQITAMWREITETSRPCDQAAEVASAALGSSDLMSAYRAVESAQRICASAALDVRGIDAPRGLDRSTRREFDEALEACSDAYAGKAVMFDRMLTVIDGDMRPSRVAAVQEAGRISQAQVVQCVLRLHTLASDQGVDLGASEEPSA